MSDSNPTQIVIFGATGDLTKRKLLHALLDLFVREKLPKKFFITGVSVDDHDTDSYRQFVKDILSDHEHIHSPETLQSFCNQVSYLQGDFADDQVYQSLSEQIGGGANDRLLYLAVPPNLYELIFQKLHDSKLATQSENDAYARVLVEKPFGHDLETAKALDRKLSELFTEDQIYRIDHYLAKEAVQNILSFRFANTFFRSPWNREYIDSVHITMHETIDVGERASFYEGVGALRDVGQNHLLQLLALVAMDEPEALTPEAIRSKRAEVLATLTPENPTTIHQHVKRAQYNEYRDTTGVATDSDTETYFDLTVYLDSDRWHKVPFHISAGKGLPEAKVSIEVKFKDVATGPFLTETCLTTENCIRLDISPEQAMSITVNAKAPGLGYQVESRTLSFACAAGDQEIKNSYEKVLLDCLGGDQTLFTTTEEVLSAWEYVTSILNTWQDVPLINYQKGTLPEFSS